MDPENYKILHENRMMFNDGTSMKECGIILSTVPFSVFLSLWITSYLPICLIPITEFLIIVLPIILDLSILSEFNHFILLIFIVFNVLILCTHLNFREFQAMLNHPFENYRSLITNYRASTNFITAICILAVDFEVFPRRFAKTETYGFSLMDLGVGFYICSNGLVEKDKLRITHPSKALKGSAVLFALGICRLVSVKALSYHEHLTEYGLHWNFFFTLSLCKFITYWVRLIMPETHPLWLMVSSGLIHELLLHMGLANWVFSDVPRNSFLSANREGLVSCLGFVTLYFGALTIGRLISYWEGTSYRSLIFVLSLGSGITLLGTYGLVQSIGVSRRIVNLGYIFWVIFLSLLVMTLFLIGQVSIRAVSACKNLDVPYLQEGINANGLFFFILSNLLTGLINFMFQTFLLNATLSVMIILCYMAILCTTTHILFAKKIQLKI